MMPQTTCAAIDPLGPNDRVGRTGNQAEAFMAGTHKPVNDHAGAADLVAANRVDASIAEVPIVEDERHSPSLELPHPHFVEARRRDHSIHAILPNLIQNSFHVAFVLDREQKNVHAFLRAMGVDLRQDLWIVEIREVGDNDRY
jgi:hypothetical protein